MARKKEEKTIVEKIFDYSLEEIMGTGFGRYAKEIIQERALPDVRDGLKPVQRRILYGMYASHFTYDKPYRKSARAVGDIMGKYHPHGDSSIYDALIRMSQPWKMREVFIDIHGNNGSIDGDGPAAMRYTESRLSKFAEVMLTSIKKNTVEMTYNFDDTELEPTVLPAGFPNLLVNGSTGISAGYATNIPPHNLGEVIDATIKRIESPNCKLETIMEVLKGPDYPTYGVLEGKNGLIDAYRTGKGKVVLKAKTEVVKSGNHEQIVVSSIPYEVVKEQLIKKINEIRIDKKVEGINEVIDESDHENLARIVIDLKNGANSELILNYLLKNTDLQINYNFNMVAIVNRRPKLVGILDILDAFIIHQREVVRRRTQFDLDQAKVQYHILEGLVKAISILDEVIRVIRASKNKSDAIDNLVKEFEFTFEQAKAIVELQLYRLTNTDIVAIEQEMKELEKNIYLWTQILNNEEALKHVMKTELKIIKKEYGNPRRTEIRDEVTEIKLDMKSMIPKENVLVVVTNEGYVKRVSLKSYASSNGEETTLKPGDYVTGMYQTTTLDSLIIFTNLGNYLFIPVHKIPEVKWKELGKHINNVVMLQTDEKVVASCLFDSKKKLVTVTKHGMIKRTLMSEYMVSRTSKAMLAMKLKNQDEVVQVFLEQPHLMIVSKSGYYVDFEPNEVPLVGVRGGGVKGINLKDDEVVCAFGYLNEDYLDVITTQKTAKRLKVDEIVATGRAKRGNSIMKKVKSVSYEILNVLPMNSRDILVLKSDSELKEIKNSEITIMDITSTGSNISKYPIDAAFKKVEIETNENEEVQEEEPLVSSKEMTIDDFIDDFKF